MSRASKFSPEVRERAMRLVFEQRAEHSSQWAAVCLVRVVLRRPEGPAAPAFRTPGQAIRYRYPR